MRTIEKTVYNWSDLLLPENSEIKEKAIENYRYSDLNEDFWANERLNSYEQTKKYIYDQVEDIQEEISGGRLVAWIQNNLSDYWTENNRIGKPKETYYGVVTNRRFKDGFYFSNSHYEYKYDCVKYRVSKIFKANNLKNCPFTGVCYDYDFLMPVIEFLDKPKSNVSNMDLVKSMPSLEDIYQKEMEYMTSDEYIIQELESRDYEFDENGNII